MSRDIKLAAIIIVMIAVVGYIVVDDRLNAVKEDTTEIIVNSTPCKDNPSGNSCLSQTCNQVELVGLNAPGCKRGKPSAASSQTAKEAKDAGTTADSPARPKGDTNIKGPGGTGSPVPPTGDKPIPPSQKPPNAPQDDGEGDTGVTTPVPDSSSDLVETVGEIVKGVKTCTKVNALGIAIQVAC